MKNKHTNKQDIMETSNFSNQSRYIVSSSFIASFDFGVLSIGGTSLNAILVTFLDGAEYIYFGMPYAVVNEIEAACVRQSENGDVSLGDLFNRTLRRYQCFARLNQSI